MEDFLLYVAVGFIAQLVDGALGMAFGLIGTSVMLAGGVPPAIASASVHAAEVFTTAISGSAYKGKRGKSPSGETLWTAKQETCRGDRRDHYARRSLASKGLLSCLRERLAPWGIPHESAGNSVKPNFCESRVSSSKARTAINWGNDSD